MGLYPPPPPLCAWLLETRRCPLLLGVLNPPPQPHRGCFRKWRTSCRRGAVPADFPKPSPWIHPRQSPRRNCPHCFKAVTPLAGPKAGIPSSVGVVELSASAKPLQGLFGSLPREGRCGSGGVGLAAGGCLEERYSPCTSPDLSAAER